MNKSFTIENDGFSLTGKPFRILSGAMHYFRIPQAYWEDRLKKLKPICPGTSMRKRKGNSIFQVY